MAAACLSSTSQARRCSRSARSRDIAGRLAAGADRGDIQFLVGGFVAQRLQGRSAAESARRDSAGQQRCHKRNVVASIHQMPYLGNPRPYRIKYQGRIVGWRRFRASGVAAAGAEFPLRRGGHILGNPESRENHVAVVAPVTAAKGHAPATQHSLESRAGARNVNLRAIAFRTASTRGVPFGRRLGSGTAEAVASQGNHRCRSTGGWRRFFHGHGFGGSTGTGTSGATSGTVATDGSTASSTASSSSGTEGGGTVNRKGPGAGAFFAFASYCRSSTPSSRISVASCCIDSRAPLDPRQLSANISAADRNRAEPVRGPSTRISAAVNASDGNVPVSI